MENRFSDISKYFPNSNILSIYDDMGHLICNPAVVVIDDWIAFQYLKLLPNIQYVVRTSLEDFIDWHRVLLCLQRIDNPLFVFLTNGDNLKPNDFKHLQEIVNQLCDKIPIRIINNCSMK